MFRNRLRIVFVLSLIVALFVTSAVSAAPKSGLTVNLSVSQGQYASSQDVIVTVTITNPTKHTERLLKWFTPMEGVEESLFIVTRNGELVSYTGTHYKRTAATGKDYISLQSGESITSVVNLGEYYDLSQSGEYEVAYNVSAFNLHDPKGNSFKFADSLSSEKVSMKVDGRAAKGKPTPPPPPPPGGNSFNACTVDRQSLLVSARNQAKAYATNAASYLNGNNQGLRYTTWFGVFNAGRHDTVTDNFNAISSAMNDAGITFDCTCKQKNVYAYVYSNEEYNIYLCGAFWSAPLSGTDSKAGTLIHEMSHFDVVAGTDDVIYGQTGAKNLAISNPDDAIRNADNHEYFAENTPTLP